MAQPSTSRGTCQGEPATLNRPPIHSIKNLTQLLGRASRSAGGLTYYASGKGGIKYSYLSYADLQEGAAQKARLLRRIDGLSAASIVLIHLDDQRETILWLWAALLAGLVPALSTPLTHHAAQCKKYLRHLQSLLQKPVILTTGPLVSEFSGVDDLRLCTVESLSSTAPGRNGLVPDPPLAGANKMLDDPAVLMLTSGSTGIAKAVPLRHGQILTAIHAKTIHHGTQRGDVFLNWIGLDHVASLCEIHFHAMSLGSTQIHFPAAELLLDPLRFICLLDFHRVAYTFAPNFFLSRVQTALAMRPDFTADLSPLKCIISGGEANVVATCDALTTQLRRFNIRGEVIRPGFGMTETCAGIVYSRACPSSDLAHGLEFASLGSCILGIRIRVMSLVAKGQLARCGVVGELQLSGAVLFGGYFNNPGATAEAFTHDGWFITGDLAWLDDSGGLNLAGRTTDTININGAKWSATEIEAAIEAEGITGLVPSYTVVFPYREPSSPTEGVAIVYCPSYGANDAAERFETSAAISKVASLTTGQKPGHLIPLPAEMLEKSSLGKISRAKVRAAFERGDYASLEKHDIDAIARYRESRQRCVATATERKVQGILAELLPIPAPEISANASIFDLGISSLNLILLKATIQDAIPAARNIPLSALMTEPTVGGISSSIDRVLSQRPVYNPIVPLQPHGSKTPLFLIHPGSGDVLVFVALAAHFPTRPVYALRTRGYNPNERLFRSMKETIQTYTYHIRKTQPKGPYALAGYSLGSTLAFEVAKRLEAQGQEVRFLGSIDYPPYIAEYISGQNWIDVLVQISFFLELIDEETMKTAMAFLHKQNLPREDALAHILSLGDCERVDALGLNLETLGRIVDIAENFRVQGEVYQPRGSVDRIDIFVADPPSYTSTNRQDWRDNKLGRWREFSRSGIEFYECPSTHTKMLNPEHVPGFVKRLKAAMKKRRV